MLTLRGELNVLLNLPGDTMVELSLDEEVLKQLDLSQLSFADLKAMVNERTGSQDCPEYGQCFPCKSEIAEINGISGIFGEW
ncbi:hypothetical protein NXV02_20575 [Bacteroides ovatus]|nr:hypothetical protein [Bacteroides ovatus]